MSEGICVVDWTAIAAWVQAVGSIAAIVAAIKIGERSSRESRDLVESERRRQADIIAANLEMKLYLAGIELGKTIQFATNLMHQIHGGQSVVLPALNLKKLFLVNKAQEIVAMRAQITIFDRDTGIAVATMLDALDVFNPALETGIDFYEFQGSKPADLAALCQRVIDDATYLKGLCDETSERLTEQHGLATK